jgi:hypothetical protein
LCAHHVAAAGFTRKPGVEAFDRVRVLAEEIDPLAAVAAQSAPVTHESRVAEQARLDPRFATAKLRRQNLADLLAEVRAWIMTCDSKQLQAQVTETGLAAGEDPHAQRVRDVRSGQRVERHHRGGRV